MRFTIEKERLTHRGRTLRAFQAFLALMDAAAWIRSEMRGQLAAFGLTLRGFRVLDMLYRDGPTHMGALARACALTPQHAQEVVGQLEDMRWVEGVRTTLEPADNRRNRRLRSLGTPRQTGVHVHKMRLTPLGEKFIGHIFPKHAKVVKAWMKALDGREQVSLTRICRKLKGGDIIKFFKEMRFIDPDEETNTWPTE
ncbi:MAG TPA: hypothetical protein VEG64_09645 [Candidatus Sulfotelmatobacter sp.]|nr:hypothetical protein [Candidatus Sulfotelmatobacter sp.]